MEQAVRQSGRGREAATGAIAACIVVLILLGAVFAYWSTNRMIETLRMVDHSREVRLALERTLISIVNVETAMRGFQISGEGGLIENVELDEQAARDGVKSLGKLIGDDPAQQERWQRLAPLVDDKIAHSRESLRVRREQGAEAGVALFRTFKGERLMNEIRKIIRQMEDSEDRLLTARSQAAHSASNMTLGVVAGGSALVTILVVMAGWLMRRELQARLEAARVQAGARAYAESIVDTVQGPLLVLGHDMRVERANRSFCETFHVAPQEAERKLLSELGGGRWVVPGLDRVLSEALTMDKPFDSLEWEADLPGVGRRSLLMSGCKLHRPGNHTEAVLLAIDDVSERKRAQQIHLEVQEANQQLRALNGELEAFSYSVSHDLRAPLRHIDGFTDLLENHAREILDDKGRRYLKTISDSAKRMGTLIDDLLVFSRMGRAEMHRARVDLNTLADEVIRELETESKGRNVVWKRADLPVIDGDSALLRLVFVNLLANALKYTRPRDPAIIEISSTDGPGEKVICVCDNGVGFDMTYAHKLFGVFQRLHRAEEFEGTGIGLANVRRIVTRHGGRVWAEGKSGEGATISFSLPANAHFTRVPSPSA